MACGHLSLSLNGLPAPGPAGWLGERSSLTSTGISRLSQPGVHLPGEGSREWGPGGEGDRAWATPPFQAASVPALLTPCSDPLELILGPGRVAEGEGKKGRRQPGCCCLQVCSLQLQLCWGSLGIVPHLGLPSWHLSSKAPEG